MIVGELCNFTGAHILFSGLRQLIAFYKAYAFVEALVVVRRSLSVTFVCLSDFNRPLSEHFRS